MGCFLKNKRENCGTFWVISKNIGIRRVYEMRVMNDDADTNISPSRAQQVCHFGSWIPWRHSWHLGSLWHSALDNGDKSWILHHHTPGRGRSAYGARTARIFIWRMFHLKWNSIMLTQHNSLAGQNQRGQVWFTEVGVVTAHSFAGEWMPY